MIKSSIIILILFFMQSCGYVPLYSKNQKIDFYIQSINFNSSDKELANFIKSDLLILAGVSSSAILSTSDCEDGNIT